MSKVSSGVASKAIVGASVGLQVIPARGWRSGLGHMLRWEGARWWRTRQWWIHTLLWTTVINGFPGLAFLFWVPPLLGPQAEGPPAERGITILIAFLGLLAVIGVLVVAQGTIVGEKQLGTAAWVLSKPLARSAFVLAKLGANALAVLLIMIVVQGALGYLQVSLKAGALLPVLPFVAMLGLLSLNLLFYLTLTVMLGTIFQSRGPVLGIAAGVLIGGAVVGELLGTVLPWLPPLLPHQLPEVAQAVTQTGAGTALPDQWWLTIVLVVAYATAAVIVALWRFGREEF
ncbi:MAG: hypothetical protein CL878_13785 [Dehalococcoidia bacterium]|nr:hypothetical protein [Dehalococcoidia bacterium]